MLMFCLSLAKSLADPELHLERAKLSYVSIQDDTYLVGPLRSVSDKRLALHAALAAGGHKLQPSKCKAWAPAWDNTAIIALPQWAQDLFQQFERAVGGIQALGAASQGRHELILGRWSLVAAKARERFQ